MTSSCRFPTGCTGTCSSCRRTGSRTQRRRMPSRLRALAVIASTAFRADRWRTIGVLLLTIGSAGAGSVSALFVKLFTDAALHRDARTLLGAVVGFTAIGLASALAGAKKLSLYFTLQEKTNFHIYQQAVAITAGL